MSDKLTTATHGARIGITATALTLLLSYEAQAQQGPVASDSGARPMGLEEIVVTAQKRSSSLQDTPLSVTAVTQDMLRTANVTDIQGLSKLSPSISFRVEATGANVHVGIRGIQSTNGTPLGDPAVALHVDGVYLARPNAGNLRLFDIERVEVLRGPQGTLYGRNATAGAINVITRKPVNEMEGEIRVGYGNFDHVTTDVMLNAPIVDDIFMVRGVFSSSRRDGFTEISSEAFPNLDDADDDDTVSGRLQALVTPNENFSILFKGDYQKTEGAGSARRALPIGENEPARPFPLNRESEMNGEWWGISAEMNWSIANAGAVLGDVTATYIGAYRETDIERVIDTDGTATLSVFQRMDIPVEQQSHELRLSGSGGQLEWIIGAFYLEEDSQFIFDVSNPVPLVEVRFNDISSTSKSVFADVAYSVTEDVRLHAGIRWNEDEKKIPGAFSRLVFPGPPFQRINQLTPDGDSEKWDKVTWKGGIDWFVLPETMAYFNAQTGFKSGGFDTGTGNKFNPENILAFELGFKSQFFDNRLRTNVAAFFYDYEDLQIQQLVPEGLFTENAADSEIKGIEFEIAAVPIENLNFRGSVGYVDTSFKEFFSRDGLKDPDGAGAQLPPVEDLTGARLPNAPKWTVSLGLDYTFGLEGYGTLTPSINTKIQSSNFLRQFQGEADLQKSHSITDINITYESPDRSWSIEAYVSNIEDEEFQTEVATGRTGLPAGTISAPRTYGLRIGHKW